MVLALGGLYVLVPQLAGLDDTWRRIDDGDPIWLAVALALETLSFASYLVLFRAVFGRDAAVVTLGTAYEITMAGLAATRMLATGGAGGVILTVWALRRLGMAPAVVAARMMTFLVLLYAVFMGALLIFGLGLGSGTLPGGTELAITVPAAVFGGAVILTALALALVPPDLADRVGSSDHPDRGRRRLASLLATVPGTFSAGVRGGIALLRRREPGALGALGWWAFDVAVLWACFNAFGEPPATAVLVMGYFVGQLGNLLPLPAGIGGVDGGMIGVFIAFGVSAGLAIVAVLAYRAFAFWLPTLPGVWAYVSLQRRLR